MWVGGSNTSGLFDESFEWRVNRKMTIPTMGMAMIMMWPGSLKTLTARTGSKLWVLSARGDRLSDVGVEAGLDSRQNDHFDNRPCPPSPSPFGGWALFVLVGDARRGHMDSLHASGEVSLQGRPPAEGGPCCGVGGEKDNSEGG